MTLTVLSVAYPFAPVGPDAIGGAEQVISRLDAALVDRGHRSLVLAAAGSVVSGTLIPFSPVPGELTDELRREARARYRAAIEQVLAACSIDLLHFHGVDFHEYLPATAVPILVTLHLPLEWYPAESLRCTRPNVHLHCVSASQQQSAPADARFLPEIENGVAVDDLAAHCSKRPFAVALGRVCPEKGFHLALDAAHRADVRLCLAGEVFPYATHVRYFQSEIVPRLDPRRVFLGPIGFRRKRRLLSAARCLLAPSLVAETSSLVAMEALACGTPVIAFSSGALADIVEHGRTGFLVRNEIEMAEAIDSAASLDPAECRRAARSRFALERMASQYLERYSQLVAKSAADAAAPRAQMAACPGLRCSESGTLEELVRLWPEWDELWARADQATPFQSPRWLVPWWRRFGNGDLVAIALRDGQRLVGLAPLAIARADGADARRVVRFLGQGLSDYLGPLFESEYAQTGAVALWEYLASISQRWDDCDFQQLRQGSPLLEALPPALSNAAPLGSCSDEVSVQDICPAVPLGASNGNRTGEALQQQLRRACDSQRRLGRRGELRIDRADAGLFDEIFDAFVRLHQARWNAASHPGVLADEAVAQFLREAAAGFLQVGLLRLDALRFRGRIVAVLYGIRCQQRAFYYLSGLDPALKGVSPGTILIGHAVEQALREGAEEFDFLRGQEPYKYAWGARDRPNFRRKVSRVGAPRANGIGLSVQLAPQAARDQAAVPRPCDPPLVSRGHPGRGES